MLPIAVALGAALTVLLLSGSRRRRRRHAQPSLPAPVAPAPGTSEVPDPGALDFALSKRLGDFSLDLSHRSSSPRLALLGPSGAGKTLTLRLLAGLIGPDSAGHARVALGSSALDGRPPERRELGYVPQQAALMPRRNVWRQVTFGARAHPALAAWWIERLGLTGLEGRYPDELSGGQQRRVALARALAVQPRVLLLDEPFAGLDAPVRDRLRRELRRLQREIGLSTVLVTHDPEEAALLADEIVVLDGGRVLQAGPRASVFRAPCSPQVAALLGIANAHRGVALGGGRIRSGGVELRVRGEPLGAAIGQLAAGIEVAWAVRPERIELREDGRYAATLLDDADLGAERELTVALAAHRANGAIVRASEGAPAAREDRLLLTVRTLEQRELTIGQALRIELPPEHVSAWPVGR
jgi:molybdate transport system permease protein